MMRSALILAVCVTADMIEEQSSMLQIQSKQQRMKSAEDCALGKCEPPEPALCVVSGDPHVKAFDDKAIKAHVYGAYGDYYLVNSPEVKIQARYCSTSRSGKAWTAGLAMKMADGRVIEVPAFKHSSREPGVYIDGKNVLACKYTNKCPNPKYEDDWLAIEYEAGPRAGHFNKDPPLIYANTISLRFANGVSLIINQGNAQALQIFVPPKLLEGTTGHCGNFNGDKNDDMLYAALAGLKGKEKAKKALSNAGDPVGEETLFADSNPCIGTEPRDLDCPKKKRNAFFQQCRKFITKGSMDEIEDCVVDCCDVDAGGDLGECPFAPFKEGTPSELCTDEQKHLRHRTNDDKTFRCTHNHCVPVEHLCDGELNCFDGSDEWLSVCETTTTTPTPVLTTPEPTSPVVTVTDEDHIVCTDDADEKFSAYWEFGNCGHFHNDYNQDWCQGIQNGNCPEVIMLNDAKYKRWKDTAGKGVTATQWFNCPSNKARLITMLKSPIFNRFKNGEAYVTSKIYKRPEESLKLTGCKDKKCEYIWHAQYECVPGPP